MANTNQHNKHKHLLEKHLVNILKQFQMQWNINLNTYINKQTLKKPHTHTKIHQQTLTKQILTCICNFKQHTTNIPF